MSKVEGELTFLLILLKHPVVTNTPSQHRVSSLPSPHTSQILYNTQFPRKVVIQHYVTSYTLLPLLSEAIHKMMDDTEGKVIFEY